MTEIDKARTTGWLVLAAGEAYYKTLAKDREFYMIRDDDGSWFLWWGWWISGDKAPTKEKILVEGLTFDEAVNRGNNYVEWWFKRKRKWNKRG